MTEELLSDRERELLDYFRNNLVDPSNRGTNVVNESFTATAGQTTFVLSHTLVKNVAETLTVQSVTKRKGYDFTVVYGEGNATTSVILRTGATVGNTVLISYHYGPSMVEREFSRTDVQLPRILMMFLNATEEEAGLGDSMEIGKGSYINASYRFEIRDEYATRARETLSKAINVARRLRHASLFRINGSKVSDIDNFDYDREKNAYIWQFTLDIEWDGIFE